MKSVFPASLFPKGEIPKGGEVQIITWESPRLSTEVIYKDRPKGSDRAICRTINAVVNVKLLNKEILLRTNNGAKDDPATKPFLNIGLYGESAGIIGAIAPVQQIRLNAFGFGGFNGQNLAFINSNGDLGSNVFSSYANLMQNVFVRVSISRGYTNYNYIYIAFDDQFENFKVPVDFSCSGAIIAADPR